MTATGSAPPPAKKILFTAVSAAVAVSAVFGFLYLQARQEAPPRIDFLTSVKSSLHAPTGLIEGLADRDGDLVADAPDDAGARLDPETLEFEVLGGDLELEQRNWADFIEHLQQATGKKVHLTLRPQMTGSVPNKAVPSLVQQARDFRDGKIHIASLNTGAVALSVNEGGAVPFCVMADADGKFGYQMEIIVPAKSAVTKIEQLQGSKQVLFASGYSHSGFKAPLMILWKEFNLQPERDYTPVFVSGQEQAIKEIAAGRGDAAPVASDLLQRIISRGDIQADSIRSIYQSNTFPPACFAYSHQLNPELATKIRSAFLDYAWQGTSLEKAYTAAHQTRFVAASYKADWESVREVEAQVAGLLSPKTVGP